MLKFNFLAALLLLLAGSAFCQTPSDLQFMPKGQICAGLTYSYNSWTEYWEGENLISNDNIGSVSRQQFIPGFSLGLLDRLNFIAMAPYVTSHASKGSLNGQSDFQDLSLHLKGKMVEFKIGPGQFNLAGTLGFSTPMSKYLVDFAPLNVGNGTTNLSYRQMFNYQLDKGFYIGAKANYTYRSNIKNIHRDFYYDQGNAYYSNEVQVDDVFDWVVALGFSNKQILAEIDFNSYNTLGGSDIRIWEPGFPTNNVDFNTLTARFDYYLTDHGGLNFTATGGYTLSGRNAGKAAFASIGINYQFAIWK